LSYVLDIYNGFKNCHFVYQCVIRMFIVVPCQTLVLNAVWHTSMWNTRFWQRCWWRFKPAGVWELIN